MKLNILVGQLIPAIHMFSTPFKKLSFFDLSCQCVWVKSNGGMGSL